MVVPMYVTEISPPNFKGAYCVLNQLMMTLGILTVFVCGALLPHELTTYSPSNCKGVEIHTIGSNWRLVALIGAITSGVIIAVAAVLPESPIYHKRFGEEEQATSFINTYWGARESTARGPRAAGNLDTLLKGSRGGGDSGQSEFGYYDLLRHAPELYNPLVFALVLMVLQQWSGINAVNMYCAQIFQDVGLKNNDQAGMYIMAVQVFGVLLSVYLVERAGRLTLLCTSIIGMASTLLVMGVFFWEKDQGRNPPELALPATMVYMLSFAIGLGPIPWLVINEIFPDYARGTAGSVAVLVNWICTFLVTQFFQDMDAAMDSYGTFWFFMAMMVAGFVFVLINGDTIDLHASRIEDR
mmetsp:Transcript_5108/g.6752  ORF Transcript_5108/g.6752 Transcript_5108/m.6752 type:complete len:355 (+) Transcript_5108:70-1134(+)